METQFPIHGQFLSSRTKARTEGQLRTLMSLEKELRALSWINSWEAPGPLSIFPGVQRVIHLSLDALTRVRAGCKPYSLTVLGKSSPKVF